MLSFAQGKQVLRSFRNNEDGNMALTFALTSVVVVGCMGAAMDFSTLSSAKKRSQAIADQTALTAAIFVKNNDRAPLTSEEGYLDGVDYSAADLGYEFKGWVDGGASNVSVDVEYDDDAKEAIVTVRGRTVPTFMQVLGQDKLGFKARSVVSYLQVDEMFPASITLVLDNSGSMRWDDLKLENLTDAEQDYNDKEYYQTGFSYDYSDNRPDNVDPRIDGLKLSVQTFRNDLRARIGNQKSQDGFRVLRTGILPYNSDIVPTEDDADRRMAWGFNGVSNRFINGMYANGSTNSNPPMAMAKTWLAKEDNKHRKEANEHEEEVRTPLKFVVFMTDGQNTSGDYEFVPESGTGRWYAYKSFGNSGQQWWVAGWQYDSDFQEGHIQLDSDRKTIESCEAMQAEGTTIYTIGYGLDVGKYYDPAVPEVPGIVTHGTQSTAYALLSACASKPENFITASDGNELEGAFDQIQNAIVKELIRIKS